MVVLFKFPTRLYLRQLFPQTIVLQFEIKFSFFFCPTNRVVKNLAFRLFLSENKIELV